MSKSLGNSPDPIELMKKYSADGVRVGMLFCSPAGNDLLFDESLTEQGRNFSNKIWNAFRLIKSWEVDAGIEQPAHSLIAAQWLDAQLDRAFEEVDRQFKKYRISDALMIIYRLFWEEFSAWYLEIIKPAYQAPIDKHSYEHTLGFVNRLLHLLHPFMPFITEEIWQLMEEREKGESLMISPMPALSGADREVLGRFEEVKEVITQVRSIRKDKNIPQKESLELHVRPSENSIYHLDLEPVVLKLGNLSAVNQVAEDPGDTISFIVKNVEYFVPVGKNVNPEEELAKMEEELSYTKGFMDGVQKKLANERFVQGAPPAVVEKERQKLADAVGKIAVLEAQILKLKV